MRRSEQQVIVGAVRRVTVAGAVLNVLLALLKGIGGLVCNSQSLVADAVHSASDLVTDVAVILGVKYWAAPADEEHPYGHGKIEALVTLFIAIALALVGYELAAGAVKSLLGHSAASAPDLAALVVALSSVALKEWLFRWTRAVARRVRSTALEANAWHHRSDALSSVPVAAAVAVAWIFPQVWWADAVGALIVAFFLLKVVWELAWPALQELVDAGIGGKAEEVAALAEKIPGVEAVHRCRARRYGGAFQADLHVQVDVRLSIAEAHALGHDVKDAIVNAGIDVTDAVIHVEPRDVRAIVSLGSNVEPRAERLQAALERLSKLPCTHLVRASEPEETEPVGVPDEFAHLKFLNQVAVFETALAAEDFARRMHGIEDALGRVRTVRNGPRTIDLDLVDFDGLRLQTPELTLPHPRARERDFVMKPLARLGIAF